MKTWSRWIILPLLLLVSACAMSPREQVGTVLGGAAGGIAGSQIGGGAGRTAAIIVGALIGSHVGREIGRSIDRTDELKAQQALEQDRRATWVNPDTNAQVTVDPGRTYRGANDQYCREYSTDIVVAGRVEHGYGTACREPDGSWRMN